MALSFFEGKGLSTTQLLNLVVNTLYDQFVVKDIKGFDGFNVGILDAFNTINMALPGKHYIAPSYKDVKDLFEEWKKMDAEEKKKKFIEFINEKVNMNKVDESMLITAILAPSAAMMAKKTGQIVPQLALMNAIPDVVFVPSATLLALTAIKIIRLTFTGKTTSKDTVPSTNEIEQEPQTPTTPETEIEEEPQIKAEQQPQTPTKPETEIEEKPQIETEQEPQTTTTPETLKEPQIETEQEPQTTTTPETLKEEPQIENEQEPQTTTTPEIETEEPQTETKQEPPTTATPETKIEKEPQPQPTAAPETSREGPQVATVQKPHIITGHVHKDNTTCFLCEELIARLMKEGRTNAIL